MALPPVPVSFHPLWRTAVDHAEDSPPLEGGSNNYLKRVGRSAVNVANLRAVLDLVENIYGIGIAQQDTEDMACTDRLQGGYASFYQLIVVPLRPDQAWPARLGKGDSETSLGHRGSDDLVQILSCLDKVGLTEDDVAPFRILDPDVMYLKLHKCSFAQNYLWRPVYWFTSPCHYFQRIAG